MEAILSVSSNVGMGCYNSTGTWEPENWYIPWGGGDGNSTVPFNPSITISTPNIIYSEPVISPQIVIDVGKLIIEPPKIEEKKEKKFRRLLRPIKE